MSQVDQCQKMLEIAVHLPVAHQTEQMDIPAMLTRVLEGSEQGAIREEIPAPDAPRDPHDLLIDHASRSDVLVPHLGVAHGADRQAHVLTTGRDQRAWPLPPQRVVDRRLGESDRVESRRGRGWGSRPSRLG